MTALPRPLELLQAAVAGERPIAPIAELLGFRLASISATTSVIELQAGPQHANPMGTLHGGVICDIADAAMGTLMAASLAEGESFTTLELKVNFLKPIWNAKLRATARVVKRTRTIGLLECDVIDEKDSLVARVSSTCLVLRGEAAQGR